MLRAMNIVTRKRLLISLVITALASGTWLVVHSGERYGEGCNAKQLRGWLYPETSRSAVSRADEATIVYGRGDPVTMTFVIQPKTEQSLDCLIDLYDQGGNLVGYRIYQRDKLLFDGTICEAPTGGFPDGLPYPVGAGTLFKISWPRQVSLPGPSCGEGDHRVSAPPGVYEIEALYAGSARGIVTSPRVIFTWD